MHGVGKETWQSFTVVGGGYALAATVLALALTGFLVSISFLEKQNYQERAVMVARHLTDQVEFDIANTLRDCEVTLRIIANYYRERATHGDLDPARLKSFLQELESIQPELKSLRIVDAKGIVRYGHGALLDESASEAEHDYFVQLRDHPEAGPVILRPVSALPSGQSGIGFYRRINAPDGSFVGMVAEILDLASFRGLTVGLDLGRNGLMSVRGEDLMQIYQYLPSPGTTPSSINQQLLPLLSELIQNQKEEAVFVFVAADGHERTIVVSKVRNSPFYVIIGLNAEDYLREWRRIISIRIPLVMFTDCIIGLLSWRLFLASRQLRNSEARWSSALEGSALGVWDWNLISGSMYYSPYYKQLLGYDSDEISGFDKGHCHLIHPDDVAATLAAFERNLNGEIPFHDVEFRMHHRQGHYIWIHSRGVVIERTHDGRPMRMIGTHIDISERKEIEKVLQENNINLEREVESRTYQLSKALTQLRLARDAADVGIWTWNFSDDRLEWDERLCELYEAPASIRQGGIYYGFWRERVHPDDIEQSECALMKSRQDGLPFNEFFRLILPSGRIIHVHSSAVIEFNSNGEPQGMVGINRDITQQRALEANLIAAKEAAETANLAKSRFLANMSHEIRTPLNAMIGLTGVLLESELTPRQYDYLCKVQLSGTVLLGILNEILDHSKIEAGLMKIESVSLRISELFDKCRALFGILASEKQLTLTFRLAPNVPPVLQGDALRLQQVINNLVGNSVKFTSEGAVNVSAECIEQSATRILLKISVSDTGIGLTPDQVERLFSAFQQADASISRKYGGTGLGLSISKRLVELMGGEIGVHSIAGKGSTFWFIVPLESEMATSEPAASSVTLEEVVEPCQTGDEFLPKRSVDIEMLLPKLQNLSLLLATGQASARLCNREIEVLLTDTSLQTRYVPVTRAIACFDFDAALAQIQRLAEEQQWDLS